MRLRHPQPRPAATRIPRFSLGSAALCAVVGLAQPSAAAPPPSAAKILVADDNTLDVEQAFLRPPRRQRHELNLTLAGTLATPLDRGMPAVQTMLQADAVLRAERVALISIVRLRLDDVRQPMAMTRLFFHQLYLSVRHPYGEVKIGKVMGQLGRLWDYGLYGPLLANADFKLTPDLGVSFEGDIKRGSEPWQLAYAAQYNVVDGRSISAGNAALFARQNVRRRHITTVRLVPLYRQERWRVALGLSGQAYEAMQPERHWVGRMAADIDFTAGPLESFVEVGRQSGADVPSAASALLGPFNYVWAGAQVTLPVSVPLKLRHHVNVVAYEQKSEALDVLQQPGLEYQPLPWLTLVAEGALWTSNAVPTRGEKSVLGFVIVSL